VITLHTPSNRSGRPVWLTWVVLVVATVVTTWVLTAESIDRRLALVAIFSVAAWKVRLVMTDFIELREAPLAGRLIFEGWAVAVPLAIVLLAWP
jgi:heme/copper-type cytochrome/quinol oxidase subunit 4